MTLTAGQDSDMSSSPMVGCGNACRWRFELAEPQLQHQQHPEHMIMIAALSIMLIEETPQKRLRDDAAIQKGPAGEMIPQETAQRSAEPVCQRNRETLLWQSEQFGGQAVRQCCAKELFAASVLHV